MREDTNTYRSAVRNSRRLRGYTRIHTNNTLSFLFISFFKSASSAKSAAKSLCRAAFDKKPRRVGGPPGAESKGAFIRPQHTREMSKPNVLGVAGGNTHGLTDRSPFGVAEQAPVGSQHAGERPNEASSGPGCIRSTQPPVMNIWADILMDTC